MKTRTGTFLLLALTLGLSLTIPATAATVYKGRPGSSVKIDGTSNIHDWTVESKLVAGSMTLPADLNQPGKLDAQAEVNISVRSLKSYKKAMDEVMHNAMNATEHPKITYVLKELVGKGNLEFEATGDLTVAGVTKEIKMPVTMEPQGGDKMVVKLVAKTKMTDFGIDPPAPKAALGMISTGDDVTVTIEWLTQKQ